MIKPPRIALIHATRVAIEPIEPIEATAQSHWPAAETVSIREEGFRWIGRKRRN